MILAQMADPQVGFYDYEPELQRLRKAIGRLNESDCEAVIVCGDMMHIVTRDSLKNLSQGDGTAEKTGVLCDRESRRNQ